MAQEISPKETTRAAAYEFYGFGWTPDEMYFTVDGEMIGANFPKGLEALRMSAVLIAALITAKGRMNKK